MNIALPAQPDCSPTAGSPAFSTDITDLNSWLQITSGEKKTIRSKLKYQIDPAKRQAAQRPLDFAIEAPAPPQSRPGADPALVGPWSNPDTAEARQ